MKDAELKRERQNARARLVAKARNQADKKLRARYRSQWDKYYEVEARKLGINPRVTAEKTRIAQLELELASLKAALNGKSGKVSLPSVRAWANANNLLVGERGTIPGHVISAYKAAHNL